MRKMQKTTKFSKNCKKSQFFKKNFQKVRFSLNCASKFSSKISQKNDTSKFSSKISQKNHPITAVFNRV